MSELIRHSYGKDGVRLVKVVRDGATHAVHDLTIRIWLEGDFSGAYLEGDNSTSLPTDTMRSTCYLVAQDTSLADIERYAKAVLARLLSVVPACTTANAELVEHSWTRLAPGGVDHPHAFRGAAGVATALVSLSRGAAAVVTSGLDELLLLKTTDSEYQGFLTDDYTVLRPTDDRIMATSVTASWTWREVPASYADARRRVQTAFETVFATTYSKAVQQTLYLMAEAALAEVPEIGQVRLTLPNRHHVTVDFTPFGRTNVNEIFVVLDRPFGLIEGTVGRS
ncbi:urate oxidase [Acidothermaceae bacterium B102]|nr:urate oxidase [Acidothermaceae bacterium B102]